MNRRSVLAAAIAAPFAWLFGRREKPIYAEESVDLHLHDAALVTAEGDWCPVYEAGTFEVWTYPTGNDKAREAILRHIADCNPERKIIVLPVTQGHWHSLSIRWSPNEVECMTQHTGIWRPT